MKITIVGLGGIGSSILPMVSRMVYTNSSSIPHTLSLVDGDSYERKNISRQQFPLTFVGMNKAAAQASKLSCTMGITVRYLTDYLTSENIDSHLHNLDPDVILSCVDNNQVRWLLSNWVHNKLSDECCKPILLIQGGNDKWDGSVHAYGISYINGLLRTIGQPIEVRHPNINAGSREGSREHLSCQELLNMPGGEQTMVANSMAAVLMFSLLQAYIHNPESLIGLEDTYFDCMQYRVNMIRQKEEGGIPLVFNTNKGDDNEVSKQFTDSNQDADSNTPGD